MAYVTPAQAAAYAAANGVAEPSVGALERASALIDAWFRFPGHKTGGRGQLRAWPRTGATDADGNEIAPDEIPAELIDATLELAVSIGVATGSDQAVSSVSLDGAVSVGFAAQSADKAISTLRARIGALLSGITLPAGIGIRLVR